MLYPPCAFVGNDTSPYVIPACLKASRIIEPADITGRATAAKAIDINIMGGLA